MSKLIRLSPSSGLSLFKDCPYCFWLAYNKNIKRPRGIFPSLPGGMDIMLKKHYDKYRGALPPELLGKIKGNLFPDHYTIKRWRYWKTGLIYTNKEHNAQLFGGLDDCLVDDGKFAPLDYKTKGSDPKEGDSERYYQNQMDSYGLMLNSNGFPAAPYGMLVYYVPDEIISNSVVRFRIFPVKIGIDPVRIEKLFLEAVNVLREPIPPNPNRRCEYCSYINEFEIIEVNH